MDDASKQLTPNAPAHKSPVAAAIPRISSRELMRQQAQLIIEHDGREYRLRVTSNGKLILTA